MEIDLRYPIGPCQWQGPANTGEQRDLLIGQIAEAPALLREAVAGLPDKQLDTPYRPGGWTVRQVVHHVPDSHMNAYVRFKLALTEQEPTIKPYDEARWAELQHGRSGALEPSLLLLESLHVRWVTLLRSLASSDYARAYRHPEMGSVTLDHALALYAWHGRHHVAHITSLRARQGW